MQKIQCPLTSNLMKMLKIVIFSLLNFLKKIFTYYLVSRLIYILPQTFKRIWLQDLLSSANLFGNMSQTVWQCLGDQQVVLAGEMRC